MITGMKNFFKKGADKLVTGTAAVAGKLGFTKTKGAILDVREASANAGRGHLDGEKEDDGPK